MTAKHQGITGPQDNVSAEVNPRSGIGRFILDDPRKAGDFLFHADPVLDAGNRLQQALIVSEHSAICSREGQLKVLAGTVGAIAPSDQQPVRVSSNEALMETDE